MRKILKTIVLAMVLTFSLASSAYAQENQSLFGREKENTEKFGPGLPGHGESGNQPAPIGSSLLLLGSMGAVYYLAKNKKEK